MSLLLGRASVLLLRYTHQTKIRPAKRFVSFTSFTSFTSYTSFASSVMARHAINRNFMLLMARNAETHRVIHGTHRNRLFRHISMARRAIHSRANMWRMIELHVRRGLKPVNTLPRDVLSLRLIRRDLLDFSIVGINRRMARRAYGDAWNRGVWPLVHADVAERTLQPAR